MTTATAEVVDFVGGPHCGALLDVPGLPDTITRMHYVGTPVCRFLSTYVLKKERSPTTKTDRWSYVHVRTVPDHTPL